MVVTSGVSLLSYLDIVLRKTSLCNWKPLGEMLPKSFYFLIIEFSIFHQIKYLGMKVLLATPSDGNFRAVSLSTTST